MEEKMKASWEQLMRIFGRHIHLLYTSSSELGTEITDYVGDFLKHQVLDESEWLNPLIILSSEAFEKFATNDVRKERKSSVNRMIIGKYECVHIYTNFLEHEIFIFEKEENGFYSLQGYVGDPYHYFCFKPDKMSNEQLRELIENCGVDISDEDFEEFLECIDFDDEIEEGVVMHTFLYPLYIE